jgi:ferritin-like metal-binding protein YciE
MATTEEKIAQYLTEAHAMELALVRTLQAHIAMTPTGDYRSLLDRHLRETREHADRIRRRLADLGHAPGLTEFGYGIAQRLIGQLLSLGKAPLDVMRGASPEEKLLKNAKDECATEALEIASYDALEELAHQAGDDRTARLAADHRAEEERMLADLRAQLPALTAAVVGAEVKGEPSYDASRTGAAQAVRRASREVQRTAGEAADIAARLARRATATTSPTQPREEQREPFSGYDELNVERITARLGELTPAQRRHVAAYERAHKNRRGVLEAVEELEENDGAGAQQPVG